MSGGPPHPADAVADLHRQLQAAQAEIARLRAALVEAEGRGEVELGRLEAGAILAMEATTAQSRARIAALERELDAVRTAAQQAQGELHEERLRADRLRSALVERTRRP